MKGRHLELKVSIYDELDLYNIQSCQPRIAPSSELCAKKAAKSDRDPSAKSCTAQNFQGKNWYQREKICGPLVWLSRGASYAQVGYEGLYCMPKNSNREVS